MKDLSNKYTMNFFLQILSFVLDDNINLFYQVNINDIISLFNLNLLENSKLPFDIKSNFELLLKSYEKICIQKDANIAINLDFIISFCFLILTDVKPAIKFINNSSYKADVISNIIYKLDYFQNNIFQKELLNLLLKNYNNKNDYNNFQIVIVSKSLNFVDYIELIYENINLFKNTKFNLKEKFQFNNYGKSDEMTHKIFSIIINCQNVIINGEFILKIYPNFIDILSLEEREKLYKKLKNDNAFIKKIIYEKNYLDSKDNTQIINFINNFILSKFPQEQNHIYNILDKLNFQNMLPCDLEKLKYIFKKFNFHSFYEKSFDSKIFFLVFNKIENIYEFPDILWSLFDSNLFYEITNDQKKIIFYKYFKLFVNNKISDSRENLFKLTNKTFNWFIKNIKNPEFFLSSLEKLMNKEEKDIVLNDTYITTLYADFLSIYYKERKDSVNNYLINYLKTRILEMDKEALEKILSIEDISEIILRHFNQYKITKNDFFQGKSKNLKLFKLIKQIPSNYIINSSYFRNSLEIIQKIAIDLQSFNYTYQELLQISSFSDQELNNRFEILQIDYDSKNSLKNKISEKIKEYDNINKKISICMKYLQKMEITDNEDKIFFQKINFLNSNFENKDIQNLTIEKIEKYLNKDCFLINLNNLFERAQKLEKIDNFECGKMFIKQVDIKNEKEENKYQEILINLNEIKNIFDKETISQMKEETLERFLNLFSSEEDFIKEIKNLKELFMIEEDDENIMEYLKYNFRKQITKKIVLSYINTLDALNLEYTKFTNIKNLFEKISELNSKEKDFESEIIQIKSDKIGKLNEIILEFESMGKDFNLKILPLDFISKILKNLWDNNLFKFLFNITNNDLRDLNSCLNGTSVDINDINNYLIVKQIIIEFKRQANYLPKNNEDEENDEINGENKILVYGKQTDEQFFKLIKNDIEHLINEMKITDINEVIKNASNKKIQVEELLKNRNGYEKQREEINLIMNESLFEIFYVENFGENNIEELDNGYHCKVIFSNKEKNKYFKDLIEMQQIASLSLNKNQNNSSLNLFIDIIDKIRDLLNYCKILTSKGYPDYFKFELSIKNEKENSFKDFTSNKIKEKTLDDQNNELKKIMKKMENLQIQAYKNTRYIKFYSGQQLLILNNFIKNKINNDKEKMNQIKHLLIYLMGEKNIKLNTDYIYKNYNSKNNEIDLDKNENEDEKENMINTNSKNNENLNTLILQKDDLNKYKEEMINVMNDMFINIESYLTKIINENELNEEKIFENSIIINNDYKDKKGLFIFENKLIYEQTLKFYKYLVGKNPPRYSILICNEETTLEELLAFLYLSFMCKFHSLFIILKPDKLQLSLKIDFQDKIEYFGKMQINSLIIFLFEDIGKSDLGKELIKMKFINKIEDPKVNLNIINEIEIISSSLAGYGKSTYIKTELEREFKNEFGEKEVKTNFKYICFPLGGEVKRSIIMKRLLKDLKINNNNYFGVHLDLSETEQIELFQDFLFSFLIQKQYTQNEDIFCYEGNVHIKIEIPKGFYDFSEKLNILKLFKQREISDLPNYKILNEIDKHFDDSEDIEKDKELYLNYVSENGSENISYVLEQDKIPENIKELRKKHRYLYQSEVQLVCNYLKLFDSDRSILREKNLFFYSLAQINYELEENNWYFYPKYIDEEECQKLIKKYLNKENCTYHQINIFIKVLYHQLKLFSNNYHLMTETLEAGEIDKIIRENLIKAILNLTKFFTIGAFDEILSEQKGAKFNYDENTIKEIANVLASKEKVINFENLKDNSLICINEDGQSLTILTNSIPNSEEYINLENLLNMGRNVTGKKKLHLIDFNSNINDDTLNFSEEINEEERKIPNFKFLYVIKKYLCCSKSIEEMKDSIGSYTFTADNFFKMILILLRLKSRISVILMGETGCGKTSLINTICDLCDFKLLKKTINAGCNDNDIVAFIGKNNLTEENLNYEENGNDNDSLDGINLSSISGIQYNDNKNKGIDKDKLIVVFFDELNTCNSQGLLTEIMCKHTIQGKKIKSNVAFIGACNPYRKKENEKEIESIGLIKKESKFSNLVYTVNPLTHSQLYYVLNFGTLNIEDEKKYIENIAEYELIKIINNKELLNIIYPFFVKSFIFSQEYIRNKNGKESVSLREIRKFFAIYKFVLLDFKRKRNYIINLDKNSNEDEIKLDYNFYKTMDDEETIHKYSITVAIFICFYVRLNLEERLVFATQANSIFKLDFTAFSQKLQEELINNINFEKGIAPNNILKLNLFITFIGILTKIAVFLVGPPGCSKTLCLNLLKKSMKGINSKSKYWKLYPQLFVISYQGSLTSTSKGIREAFRRADLTLKKWKEKKSNQKVTMGIDGNDIISLVFIDEIGLCEISPFNPLKVLHSFLELDYKDNEANKKIAFVGISNWKLDASKMNRGIYLKVFSPESNINEMLNTALEISKIYSKYFIQEEKNKNLINYLVKAVYRYKSGLNTIKDKNRNFHGTRDFYYLIKTLVRNILSKQSKNLNIFDEVFFAIESNYNGLFKNNESSASKAIETEFIKFNPIEKTNVLNKFNTMELISNNIKDNESRYLLLITKSNLSQYLVKKMVKSDQEEREIIYYLGSLFEEDLYSEAYSAKVITRIKYYLEEPIILILKNLSTTYASLYDLFNQRFNYSLGKKYTEISMRDVSSPSLVNDALKIIILIDQKNLEHQDPPFINRFQKHIISFEVLLSKEEMEISNKIFEIKNLFQQIDGIKFNPENQLINFYKEEIYGLIFYSKYEYISQKLTYEDYENFILSKLAKTFSQDLVMFLNVYQLGYKNLVDKINLYYKNSVHSNLQNYLINVEESKNIIYTFTSILKNNFKIDIINNKFGKIIDKDINNIIIKNIKSERALEKTLDDFYFSNQIVCMLHFENDDLENLEFISNYIERIEISKYKEKNKIFIIVVHLKRSLIEPYREYFMTNLSSYYQSFVDNFEGRDEEIYDIIGKTQKELFYSSLINVEEEFSNNIYSIFTTIEYIFEDKSINSNQFIQNNINILLSKNKLKNDIIEKVVDKIAEQEKIYDSIFRNQNFDDKEFVSMIVKELKEKFIFYLFKFIVNSEKSRFIYFHSGNYSGLSKEIWENYLLNKDFFSEDISFTMHGNKIKVFPSNLPSYKSIKEIRKIIEISKNEYQMEENKIRYFNSPSDLLYDLNNIKKMDENSEEFIKKQKLIDEYFLNINKNITDYKFANIKDLINSYFVFPKENLINNLVNILKKDEIYLLIPKNHLKEGLELLFEDYYSQYCYEIIGDIKKEFVELIRFLINLRFSIDKDNLESYYIKSVLWIEIYKEEMIYILNIIKEILSIEPNIISLIKDKYENKEIEYIISLHHPLFKKQINYPFLIYLDSISLILLDYILNKDFQNLIDNLSIFSNINKKAEIINLNLRLLSKDFYRFKITYLIIELLNKKNILKDKQLLDQYINSLFKERNFIRENDFNKALNEFNNQYDLLFNNFRGLEGFEKLMISLIVSKYKEVNDEQFRSQLCSKIKNNDTLIKFSTELFVLVFRRYRIEPYYLEENNNEPDNPFSLDFKDNLILKEIDGGKNGIPEDLKEILKTIFKFNIIQYFKDEIENKTDKRDIINILLGENAFNDFKNAYENLKNIMFKKFDDIYNYNIKEQYCISYCNVFLENFVKYCFEEIVYSSGIRNNLLEFLNDKENETPLKNSIKIVILKIIKAYYIKDQYIFMFNKDIWSKDYYLDSLTNNYNFISTDNLLHLFYNGKNEETFKKILDEKVSIDKNGGSFLNLNENNFFNILDCLINQNISNLKSNKIITFYDSNSFLPIINFGNEVGKTTKKLIDLFFDKFTFNSKIKPIIEKLSTDDYELLLFSYKLSLSCSLANKNSIYSKMIGENCINEIYDSYIPGAELFSDLFVESYYSINKYIEDSNKDGYGEGFYICNCGEWYYNPYCGVPVNITYCLNCKKEVGGIDEILTKRGKSQYEKEIIRIYYDETNKENVETRDDLVQIYANQWYDSKLLKDFNKEIENKINKDYKGINCNNYLLFINENKQIRQLYPISYRILSYIIYSNIFFDYILEYLSLNDLKEKQIVPLKEEIFQGELGIKDDEEEQDFSSGLWDTYRIEVLKNRDKDRNIDDIIHILNTNWKLLKKELEKKNINNIYCFMNIIFDEINQIIKNSKEMKTAEDRIEFEKQFNEIINTHIINYNKLSENYLKICNIYEGTSKDPILGFPQNIEDKYPYLYDLFSIRTVSKEGIIEIIDSIDKSNDLYPALYYYLHTNEDSVNYLQNINLMNEFVLFTIENYSYQIDREKAKNLKMSSEVKNGKIPIVPFNNFKLAFNDHNIYLKELQYNCISLKGINKKKLDEISDPSLPLYSFLIDNGDFSYGMQIAAIYQDFSKIQNSFLQNIKPKINKIERLKYLVKKMEEKIPPQKAKKCNIISFKINSENYNCFLQMLLLYSYKDSYGNIKYDLNSIENDLESILLPEKKLFDDNIYVIYQYESFRNNNSSVIPNFCENFPQIELNDKEKQDLYSFRDKQESNDSNKKILFSIQLLIFYLSDKNNKELVKNKTIKEILNDNLLPNFIHMSEETIKLFDEHNFSLSKLFSVYEYFELLCYDDFKKNTDEDYMEKVPDEKLKKLNEHFEKKDNAGKGYLITKVILSSAVRKFISRFLSGKRNEQEVNCNFELFTYMQFREDIWKKEVRENNNFERELSELIQINILAKNSIDLYEVLGGDNILLGEEVKKEIQIKENKMQEEMKEKEEEERTNINRGRRRRNQEIIF